MERSARGAALAVAIVAAGWVSAGPAPVLEVLHEAPAPTDFTRDFVSAHARLARGRGAPPLVGEQGNAYAKSIGAPEVALWGAPYYVHPPPAFFPVAALVPLGFACAARAWLALSLAALAALAFGLVALAQPEVTPRPTTIVATFVALALWPPVLHCLAKGQWSIALAAFVTLGWRALERRRSRAAGAWLGAAVSLKVTPALLLGYLALRDRRATATLLAVVAGAVAASAIVSGVEPWRLWVAELPPNVAVWQTWAANTASLNGLFARLFVGGPFARPWLVAPTLARALDLAAAASLVGWTAAVTWRTPASRAGDRALGAGWIALVVLVNPLAWTHTATLALPALALLVGVAPPWPLVASFALLSVPRQTLQVLAGPLPVGPATAPLLSLHAAALVVIVVTALRCARSSVVEDPP